MGSLIVRLDVEYHDPDIRSIRPGRAAGGSN